MARTADEARKAGMQTYRDQIIPTGATISNTAATTGYSDMTATANQDARILFEMSEPDRKMLAQRLKNAGYKVSVTGKYSDALLSAYSSASMKAALQSQMVGQAFTVGQYLDQETAARIAAGGDGDGPNVSKNIRISDETTARTLINAVLQDALGRGATKEELKKYTSSLQKAQREAPVVTTYSTAGDVQTATTTGGINEEQFLIQQIAGTDEARANKVFNYYDAFKTALGVR
jgi:hypothetical protein